MRVWFSGGPLDGREYDLHATLPPPLITVTINEFQDDLKGPPIQHGAVAWYRPIPNTEGGYEEGHA